MLGVILEVYPSDREENRTAQQYENRHSFMHTCSVLVINDGTSAYLRLQNVIITPDSPTGIDDYTERLPRGSSGLCSGGTYSSNLQKIDPYDLDGDWCVVGFLGGLLDTPYIVRWWPNSRNTLDPATSGAGVNNSALVQNRRYFHRINGVETTITSEGDIVLSTNLANSAINLGQKPRAGRFARTKNPDVGGSVRAYIKPSQSLEFVWDEQMDGIGIRDTTEPELPQINPPQTQPQASGTKSKTYIFIDQNRYESRVPMDHRFVSQEKFIVESTTETEITVGTDLNISVDGETTIETTGNTTIIAGPVLELEGVQIKLGANANIESVIKGVTYRAAETAMNTALQAQFGIAGAALVTAGLDPVLVALAPTAAASLATAGAALTVATIPISGFEGAAPTYLSTKVITE
jgi:hypothetical protein